MEFIGATILIVEDDETIAIGLQNALEHERFSVMRVDSGERALEAIEDDLPNLLVLDIMLPGMDGLSVLRRVKADHPELPIILLTSTSAELDRVSISDADVGVRSANSSLSARNGSFAANKIGVRVEGSVPAFYTRFNQFIANTTAGLENGSTTTIDFHRRLAK